MTLVHRTGGGIVEEISGQGRDFRQALAVGGVFGHRILPVGPVIGPGAGVKRKLAVARDHHILGVVPFDQEQGFVAEGNAVFRFPEEHIQPALLINPAHQPVWLVFFAGQEHALFHDAVHDFPLVGVVEAILRFGIMEILAVEIRAVDGLFKAGEIEPVPAFRALEDVEIIDHIHPYGRVGQDFHGRFRKTDGGNLLLRQVLRLPAAHQEGRQDQSEGENMFHRRFLFVSTKITKKTDTKVRVAPNQNSIFHAACCALAL